MRNNRRKDTGPVELNMVPIMNLFLAMIPFLLSCAAFFQTAVINASVPALGGGSEDQSQEPKKELDKITLKLQITKEGFSYAADGDQPEAELKRISGKIRKKGNEFDYDALRDRCEQLKKNYPKSETVIIIPEKDILYDIIVQTMDATRERTDGDQQDIFFPSAVVSSLL